MATWAVNTTADDGSVDTNPDSPTYRTGSLRGCIGAAASGDTIVFDADVFKPNEETTIIFDSGFTEPTKTLVIDATQDANGDAILGSTWLDNGVLKTRVIFDFQALRRFFYRTGGVVTLKGITVFNCSSSSAGALYLDQTSSAIINNCVFKTCITSGSGGAIYAGASTSVNVFNTYFINCTSTGNGGSLYVTGTTQITVANCVFIPYTNNTQTTIFNRGTKATGSLLINGSINCDIVQFSDNSTTVINGKLTTDVLTVSNGASVTFSGVDSVLGVTTTATIGSATFTAPEGSSGYAAFPSGTDTSAATFTGVKTTSYGANVTSVAASIDEDVATIDVTATDPAIPYLVEGSSDGGATWQTQTLVDKKTTLASAKAYKFRTFDGHFVSTNTIPRVYYYNGAPTAGSFAAAADWALDEDRSIVCPDSPTIAGGVFYCV